MNRELEVLDFIDSLPKGSVLYDLGACEGRFAIYAALSGIRCFAFEPESRNLEVLQTNKQLNDLGDARLRVFKLALGAERKQSQILIGQPWPGGHHRVIADNAGRDDLDQVIAADESEVVEVAPLDFVIDDLGLPLPDFLKIDIDGSEWPFMGGARKTLAEPSLKGLIFELYEKDTHFREILEALTAYGFCETSRHEVEPHLFNIVFERAQG